MSVEIKVPSLGESVVEATVAKWYKNEGDSVSVDEPLLELETDKVTLEVPSPSNGCIQKINAEEGSTVEVGAILGSIDENASIDQKVKQSEPVNEKSVMTPEKIIPEEVKSPPKEEMPIQIDNLNNQKLSPAVRKIAAEKNININTVTSSREDGRITKSDVINYQNIEKQENTPQTIRQTDKREERVPMSRLRQTIAKRLKDAQNNAEVNAEIENNDVIYKNFYNIGVAVGTDQGLVVPVVKDADKKSLVEVEKEIYQLGQKARSGQLSIEDMQGGTFTISNGGVYGSLMSTPILNPPQSGILGMHKIEERPIAIDGEITIRPMMYLALSYDHRIVDGKGAVTFLVRVKEGLEDPSRLLLGV